MRAGTFVIYPNYGLPFGDISVYVNATNYKPRRTVPFNHFPFKAAFDDGRRICER